MKTLSTIIGFLFMGLLYGQGEKTIGLSSIGYWDVLHSSPTIGVNTTYNIQERGTNELVFLTEHGVKIYNKTTEEFYAIYSPNLSFCPHIKYHYAVDDNLLATEDGIYTFSNNSVGNLPNSPKTSFYDIQLDTDDEIWAASDEGLYYTSNNNFNLLTTNDGLISDTTRCLLIDNGDNKWVGTNNGLSVYDNGSFTNYDTNSGLIDNQINVLAQDNLNRIWVGTNAGINIWDGNVWDTLTSNDGLVSDTINAILIENDSVWVATTTGVSLWDGQLWQSFQNFPSQDITCIFNDGTQYWLGLRDYGVLKWLPDGSVNDHIFDLGMLSNNTYDVLVTPDEKLWIATDKGLSIKTLYNEITIHSPPSYVYDFLYRDWNMLNIQDGLVSDDLRALAYNHVDSSIWVGSTAGVSHIHNNTITNYTANNVLSSDTINDIEINAEGTIWIATDNGITTYQNNSWSYLDTSNTPLISNTILQITFHPSDSSWWVRTDSLYVHYFKQGQWTKIDTSDGLPSDEIVYINSLEIQNNTHQLFISTKTGTRQWENDSITDVDFRLDTLALSTLSYYSSSYEFFFSVEDSFIASFYTGIFPCEDYRIFRNANEQTQLIGIPTISNISGLFIATSRGVARVVPPLWIENISPSPTLIPLYLYPNPSTHSIHIEGIEKEGYLHIYNIQGQLLYEEQVLPTTTHTIDIQSLPQGVYILHYKNDEGIGTQQFIKQ